MLNIVNPEIVTLSKEGANCREVRRDLVDFQPPSVKYINHPDIHHMPELVDGESI